jgi:hypothetical protein
MQKVKAQNTFMFLNLMRRSQELLRDLGGQGKVPK